METTKTTTWVDRVLEEVDDELEAQDRKWGEQNHPDGTGPATRLLSLTDVNLDLRIGEELAELFRHKADRGARHKTLTWRDILLEEVFEALAESDSEKVRAELVQVAAVAVQWVKAIDRRQRRVDDALGSSRASGLEPDPALVEALRSGERPVTIEDVKAHRG